MDQKRLLQLVLEPDSRYICIVRKVDRVISSRWFHLKIFLEPEKSNNLGEKRSLRKERQRGVFLENERRVFLKSIQLLSAVEEAVSHQVFDSKCQNFSWLAHLTSLEPGGGLISKKYRNNSVILLIIIGLN